MDYFAILDLYPVYKRFSNAASLDPTYSFLLKGIPGEHDIKNPDVSLSQVATSSEPTQHLDLFQSYCAVDSSKKNDFERELLEKRLRLLKPGPAPGFKESILGLGNISKQSQSLKLEDLKAKGKKRKAESNTSPQS